jgi:heme exporter protein A
MKGTFTGRGVACRRGERRVFEGLDFTLPASGALVLTGPNGSGKSSLLRLMAGLAPSEEGVIAWDDAPIADDPAAHRARLHFIGHADALKPVLTVAETVSFWAGMRGSPAAGEALDQFRLAALTETPCRLLSQGQRRRLALTRLVASQAELWLLDEPFAGLDEDSVADLYDAIDAHRGAGGRIVLSTHAPLALADQTLLPLGAHAARQHYALFA